MVEKYGWWVAWGVGLARWAVLAWEHGSKTRGGWFLLMDGERVIGLTVNSFTSGRPYWVACSRDAAFLHQRSQLRVKAAAYK